MYRVF